jgi:hypothetical protein
MRFEDLGRRFTLMSEPTWPRDAAASLAELSLTIVREVRGPMRLWDFARRLEEHLGMPRLPTAALCDAVKTALQNINDPRVAILCTSMPGVGYVYDARDPDARPVRASR